MLKVGITGGIGSGKSTIAKAFEVLGIPVYYADMAARNLMNESPVIRKALIEHFGRESYIGEILNRPFIAQQVFNNKEKLELLNSLTHPVTIQDSEDWMEKQTSSYAIKEAALFFESGSQQYVDVMIGVYAPKTTRIHRIMQRDGITREAVLQRMSNQINEEIKMRLCDYVIVNDDQQPVLEQVLKLHEQLSKPEFLALPR